MRRVCSETGGNAGLWDMRNRIIRERGESVYGSVSPRGAAGRFCLSFNGIPEALGCASRGETRSFGSRVHRAL
jgi:hypothetical protein